MKVIAHRGGTDQFPELTIDAARHSLELGADYVELDIRFAKDGIPVISHDDNAIRLFGNPANIQDMTAEQYVSLRYTSDESYRPHTLEEVLASGVAPILFHIKTGSGPLERILELIRSYHYEDKVVMGVSTAKEVLCVKTFNDNIKVLAFMRTKDASAEFINSRADLIRLWEDWVDEEAVRHIRDSGKLVWIMAGSPPKGTFGHASPEHIALWEQLGVDGILVDKIAETQSHMRQSKID